MANPILIALSAKHRNDMRKLSVFSDRQMTTALNYAQTLPDAKWGAFIRASYTDTVASISPLAASLSAEHFDTTRGIWIAQYGLKRVKSFGADPSLVMSMQEELISGRKKELGFFVNKVYSGELVKSKIVTQVRKIASSAIADHGRSEQKMLAQEDSLAQSTQRMVEGDGCEFCMLAAMDSFAGEGDLGFHSGCGCTMSVQFSGGDPDAYKQDWMDEFGREMAEAKAGLSSEGSDFSSSEILAGIRSNRSENVE